MSAKIAGIANCGTLGVKDWPRKDWAEAREALAKRPREPTVKENRFK
jgi:hypothetical protein